MEKEKSKGAKALQEWRKNATPEELEAMNKKKALSRRKNVCDKKKLQRAGNALLEQYYRIKDENGKMKKVRGSDLLMLTQFAIATDKENPQCTKAFLAFSERVEGKPVAQLEVDATVRSVEEVLKEVQDEEEW